MTLVNSLPLVFNVAFPIILIELSATSESEVLFRTMSWSISYFVVNDMITDNVI